MKEKIHKFWNDLTPTCTNMVLHKGIESYDEAEQQEILALLPNFNKKQVLEIGAGIGRFTGHLAQSASHVKAIDLASHFLEKNKQTHKQFTNIDYTCCDARDLCYPDKTFDFIFINWLFLYFEDKEFISYLHNLHAWLKPGGHLFLRESCFHDVREYQREDYIAIYRFQSEYHLALERIFSIENWGMIETYIRYRNLPNQFYWLCQKKS